MKLEMPEPTKSDGPPAPLQINTVGWHLNISDLHLPHFDKKVLDQAFREGKRKKVKTILFNGDTLDCHALSRHAKHKKSHDYGYEIDLGDELLQYTRQQFPDARLLWKNGNHEERAAVYLQEKAKELSELKALQLCNMLNFKQHGVEAVEDRRVVRFGKLNVVHGHEFGPGGGVNPARWLFLKSCQVVMCGHFHRTSEHFDRNINDFHNACWSTGCMCDLHPFWNPLNKWNHGFATIELNGRDGGDFHVENHRVIKGEIV